MNGNNNISSKQVIAKLTEMGFENSNAVEAVKVVGPSVDDAVESMLNGCRRNNHTATSSSISTNPAKIIKSSDQKRQSTILEHFQSINKANRVVTGVVEQRKEPYLGDNYCVERSSHLIPVDCSDELDIGADWEQKVNCLLQKQFGYLSLKGFQREALTAWLAHQDCLVLAATGSGKSLCFQIPALLTGKVVVVISPLISLMHDQCLKLAKHGVSACFLGSGQPDSTVEKKAMRGMYSIIYVCPETVLRLIKPLQGLAESCGIALFAIDEVHCVSKWGHDFRPDYRKLSVLRENFSASSLKFLKFDIPVMALTATATVRVREDILKSLSMSQETKVVVTSFFRPNLRFSVKHSRTSSPSSYKKDFQELINIYARTRKAGEKKQMIFLQESNTASDSISEVDAISENDLSDVEEGYSESDDGVYPTKQHGSRISKGKEMSVEYLENEVDVFRSVDDWDVAFGEFCAESPHCDWNITGPSETLDPPNRPEDRHQFLNQNLGQGPTIIYVPTRKETLNISKFLCGCGVKAAAYNATLPKQHLRHVHKEFHENTLEVIVATIAFGMGIDKLNVRRIIHYGWPQSLEAYYQEAGRAGRDGKLADCILVANLKRVPSLLPSKRSEEQIRQAYKMLSDCFRYGMNTSCCRAKRLVEYFGEKFSDEKCLLCDVCVNGPPEMQNLKEEADILMQVIAAYHARITRIDTSYYDGTSTQQRFMQKPNLRMFVSKIREQSQKFTATDVLWWQGLARIMEGKGLIREGDGKTHVQLKIPEPTELGLEFLRLKGEQTFYVNPEADMQLSETKSQSYSRFSDWGKGWADPEIRRQRLERMQSRTKQPKPMGTRGQRSGKLGKRKPRNRSPDVRTVRGRITAKLLKK
ncbi:ATP-dependent DNA helicase Q-like SIM isoform X2 [Morus notabilis]|uniref:ATP-dependent DNA helicase Q-like SIM isoform X2 n=1 Tax=Morus notabilis TaxID=981085 RepID=UPI000CECE6E9|nr:ATP-dependent DNA helicase Q-like SIM isoform X2 [Morus notabilis]